MTHRHNIHTILLIATARVSMQKGNPSNNLLPPHRPNWIMHKEPPVHKGRNLFIPATTTEQRSQQLRHHVHKTSPASLDTHVIKNHGIRGQMCRCLASTVRYTLVICYTSN